ncbi:MAG: hypothetical protein U1F77_05790 [Kiritimatiellia bacterium]
MRTHRQPPRRRLFRLLTAWLIAGSTVAAGAPDVLSIAREQLSQDQKFWTEASNTPVPERLSIRQLFGHALVVAAADQETGRLVTLFKVAGECQDRNPDSPSYGNFRWYYGRPEIIDQNSVEFCMEPASVLWAEYRDRLPAEARLRLHELMRFSLEACMRRNVRPSYTNISLMNAANLILLGQALERPDALALGRARLDTFLWTTWDQGVCEYGSPTYYGVDIAQLQRLWTYAPDTTIRAQADALLHLFWLDVAANWFDPADRYAGAWSRSYDYPTGQSVLVREADRAGWGRGKAPAEVLAQLIAWPMPAGLRQQGAPADTRFVRQSWGPRPDMARAHSLFPDLSFGTSSAGYHDPMDIPLAIDLPGGRQRPRLYFIADGRNDPLGIVKFPEPSGHMKAKHLRPFFTSVQNTTNALAIVIHNLEESPPHDATALSHFVLPGTPDAIYAGARFLPADYPPTAIAINEPVFLRYGTASVALRVCKATRTDGSRAGITLTRGKRPGDPALLTVIHATSNRTTRALAVFDVRVHSGAGGNVFPDAWRKQVERDVPSTELTGGLLRVQERASGLRLAVGDPFKEPHFASSFPPPARSVLEVNGREIGRPLLESVEPLLSQRDQLAPARPVQIGAAGAVELPLTSAFVLPPMERKAGELAFPAREASLGGYAAWLLESRRETTWYLWAEIIAPDPQSDSMLISLMDADNSGTSWRDCHFRPCQEWTWMPVGIVGKPHAFAIGSGRSALKIAPREPGLRIRRLMMSPDAGWKP